MGHRDQSEKVHVVHVAPFGVHPHSGLLTSLVHASVALTRRGHRVEVWQLSRWPPEVRDHFGRLLAANDVECLHVAGVRLAIERLEASDLDLMHLHGVFNLRNNDLARRLRIPFVVSPHGGYAPESLAYHRGRKILFKHLAELPMLRRAALVCALTEIETRDIARFGVRRPASIAPNGVDRPPENLDRVAFRQSLGIAADELLAIYVGRLDVRAKRLDTLVESISRNPSWHLALVGGDYRNGESRLLQLIESAGGGRRIHLPGPRRGRQLQEALAGANLFVLPSRSEGMPMALLEALVVGTPALVSPEVEGSVPVAGAGAGWATPPENFEDVLATLAQISEEDWQRRQAAAVRMARSYDWDDVIVHYEVAYRTALAGQ